MQVSIYWCEMADRVVRRCAKVPQFQLQGQLLARLLSGRAQLPPQQHIMQASMGVCWVK
jgi:hypothetical protein